VGQEHRVGQLCQPRGEAGLVFVDVEPGGGDRPFPQRCHQRRLVHQRTPRRVHQHGVGRHACEGVGVDQVSRLGRRGTVDRHEVGPREQRVLPDEAGVERAPRAAALSLGLAAAVHQDLAAEAETEGGRHAQADASGPDDADDPAVDRLSAVSQRIPALEAPLAREAVAFDDATRRREHQRDGDLGGGVGEHSRRVGHADAEASRRVEIDVLVAHREGGHDAQRRRQRLEQIGVDAIAERADEGLRTFGRGAQSVRRRRLGAAMHVDLGVGKRLGETAKRRLGNRARHEDPHGGATIAISRRGVPAASA
jgi:hypothetical protein